MAGNQKSLELILVVLFIGCLVFINEGRSLNSVELKKVGGSVSVKNSFDGLLFERIRDSGPSPKGKGHPVMATPPEVIEEKKTGKLSSEAQGHKATIGEFMKKKPSVPSPGHGNHPVLATPEVIEENKTGKLSLEGQGHKATIGEFMKKKPSVPSPGHGNHPVMATSEVIEENKTGKLSLKGQGHKATIGEFMKKKPSVPSPGHGNLV